MPNPIPHVWHAANNLFLPSAKPLCKNENPNRCRTGVSRSVTEPPEERVELTRRAKLDNRTFSAMAVV